MYVHAFFNILKKGKFLYFVSFINGLEVNIDVFSLNRIFLIDLKLRDIYKTLNHTLTEYKKGV